MQDSLDLPTRTALHDMKKDIREMMLRQEHILGSILQEIRGIKEELGVMERQGKQAPESCTTMPDTGDAWGGRATRTSSRSAISYPNHHLS